MSGSTIGGIVGGVVGAFFGSPQLGYAIGSLIGGAIDPEEIRGPSIGDAQQQTSQAGVPRPVVYGHPAPFRGNVIDGEGKARKIEQTESGKGGPEVTTERFILTSAIRICEGPIAGVLRIWRNDQIVLDASPEGGFPEYEGATEAERLAYIAQVRAKGVAALDRITIYLGTEDQLPDPTLEAIHGVGNTPYYRGTAYIVVRDDDVTDMGGACAQWKFEVLASATESSILHVLDDMSPVPAAQAAGGLAPLSMHISEGVSLLSGYLNFTAPPLVKFEASRITYPGNGPIRAQAFTTAGVMVFDSGWMGDPAYAAALRDTLDANGRLDLWAPIVNTDLVEIVHDFPSSPADVFANLYRAGVPGEVSSAVQLRMYVADPDTAPDDIEFTMVPEMPHVMLGNDGEFYTTAWGGDPGFVTLTPGDVLVADTVADIASRCGVPASKLDLSALAGDVLPGLLVAQQAPGADAIRPTQRAYFYDTPEYDGKIRAIKRGGAIAVTVTDDDLIETDSHDYRDRPQEVEFPRLVSVITQDPDANYAPVPQTSLRSTPDVRATSEVQIQLAIPFRADQSRQIAEKLHKAIWAQAEGRIELPLPEQFSGLVPSDCLSYLDRRWLIEQTEYADGQLIVRGAYDRASAYESEATGQAARPPALPSAGLSGPTLMEILNGPILRDEDDRIGLYVAISGMTDGWQGASIQTSTNDGSSWVNRGTFTQRSIMGRLVSTLPDAIPDVLDEINTAEVTANGDLSSVTFEQLLNEANAAYIGNEIVQFQTATLNTAGIWELSTLSRGRLETEAAEHPAHSRFVLLNAPIFVELPAALIGTTFLIRAVTIGQNPDTATAYSFHWDPVGAQSEWAPVAFTGWRDTNNNLTFGWVGQGRLGTNRAAGNSQFFDRYRITLTKGGTSRTYFTTNQSFTYLADQQTADFGSATGTITASIAALNRITGAASAELTGSVI